MKLPELRDLAKQMGLRGTSTMRKPDLVATITAARNGGEAPAGVTVRVPKVTGYDIESLENLVPDDKSKRQYMESDASRNALDDIEISDADVNNREDKPRYRESLRGNERDNGVENDFERRRFVQNHDDNNGAENVSRDLDQILALLPGDEEDEESSRRSSDSRDADLRRQRGGRDYNRGDYNDRNERSDHFQRRMRARTRDYDEEHDDRSDRDERSERSERGDRSERMSRAERMNRSERMNRAEHNDRSDRSDRSDRNADRESHREEQAEELVPVAGIIDVLESYAFVRTSGYLPGPNDVYVSMSQIKKYGLRKGDAVQGSIRAPRESDRRNQRQKFVPLQSVDTINGMSVEDAQTRPQFAKLTPLYPHERLKQETTANRILGRVIDLVAPIGKGQRGLIVSPPKAGKTITLQNIANAITTNNPEVHLMVVLVDERPEEVTDMERTVQGEVISSTFDRPATDHTTVAELAIERAKRLVELGQDVVVLLDSMTRLARAYNIAAPASGRILSGGVDAQALYPPKKFFGAARNIEDGGSLTIISSALVETGSKMDEVIFEEFKGTGNMELRLSRDLADKRLFPAVDINASGTRREELITPANELPIIYRLRRLFGGLDAEQAYQTLVPRLKKTASNRDFLTAITQQAGAAVNNGASAQSAV